MSELTDKALVWLSEAVTQAITEAQGGDTHLINALGYHPGAQYYINNVHGRPDAVMVQWKQWYPNHLRDVERLYESYLQQQALVEAAAEVANLKAQMAELAESHRKLVEQFAANPIEVKVNLTKGAVKEATEEAAPEPDAPVEPIADEQPKRKGKKSGSAEAAEPSAEPAAEGDKKEEAE